MQCLPGSAHLAVDQRSEPIGRRRRQDGELTYAYRHRRRKCPWHRAGAASGREGPQRGETIARWAPGSRVVKAIPPFAEHLMAGEARIDGRPVAAFVCSDDPAARAIVARLVADLGAEPVDAGPLAAARAAEPFGLLMVQLAYRQKLGPRIGVALLRDMAPL
jgi:hypothetical protein